VSESDAAIALRAHIAKIIALNPHTYLHLQSYRNAKRRLEAIGYQVKA
jgi:hypothetical protein